MAEQKQSSDWNGYIRSLVPIFIDMQNLAFEQNMQGQPKASEFHRELVEIVRESARCSDREDHHIRELEMIIDYFTQCGSTAKGAIST